MNSVIRWHFRKRTFNLAGLRRLLLGDSSSGRIKHGRQFPHISTQKGQCHPPRIREAVRAKSYVQFQEKGPIFDSVNRRAFAFVRWMVWCILTFYFIFVDHLIVFLYFANFSYFWGLLDIPIFCSYIFIVAYCSGVCARNAAVSPRGWSSVHLPMVRAAICARLGFAGHGS